MNPDQEPDSEVGSAPTPPRGFVTYAHIRGASDRAIAHRLGLPTERGLAQCVL